MDMVEIMRDVLNADAARAEDEKAIRSGKTVARVIGEALARDAMDGDIKATALLMELAGADFRSRDSEEKHLIDREKLNLNGFRDTSPIVLQDERPE